MTRCLRVPNTATAAAVTGYKSICLLLIGVRCSFMSVTSTSGKILPCIFSIEKRSSTLLCVLRLHIISYSFFTVARIYPHFRSIIWHLGQEKHTKKSGIGQSQTSSSTCPPLSFCTEDLSPCRVNVSCCNHKTSPLFQVVCNRWVAAELVLPLDLCSHPCPWAQ